MRNILIGGMVLWLSGAIGARSRSAHWAATAASAKPAAERQANPLVFVFVRVDAEQGLAILRPMIAPDIGVQVDSGSPKLEKRTVLQCHAANRERDALVEGEPGKITEMLLDCGEHKFVVKGLDFSPHR